MELTQPQKSGSAVDHPEWKILERITADLRQYYPKTVLLFGSMARFLSGRQTTPRPRDIDLLTVGNSLPVSLDNTDYGMPIELHHFEVDRMVAIARSLRYDSKAVALSKLYASNVVRGHAREVIAAALLLGPGYGQFGIQQIEIEDKPDPRDYSIHLVLSGNAWWQRICDYARQRRGPLKRFSDKIVQIDVFKG